MFGSAEGVLVCAGNVLSTTFHGQEVMFRVITFSTQHSSQELPQMKSDADVGEKADSSLLERLSDLSLDAATPSKGNGSAQVSSEEHLSSYLNPSATPSPSSTSSPLPRLKLADYEMTFPNSSLLDGSSMSAELPDVLKPTPAFHLGRISLQTRLTFAGFADEELDPLSAFPSFAEVGGMQEQIQLLRELLLLPLSTEEAAHEPWRTGFPHGLLLHGPPGAGKTLLARSTLREAPCLYKIFLTAADILQEGLECDKKLKEVFAVAQMQAPSLVVIDELDTLCPGRELGASESEKRATMSLTAAMDTLSLSFPHVAVLATTSRIEVIDSRLRRPGRFDCEVEILAPSSSERQQILSLLLTRFPNDLSEVEVAELASLAHGHVGSDLRAVCQEAGRLVRQRVMSTCTGVVTKHPDLLLHFKDMTRALKSVHPSALREVAIEVPKVCKLNVCCVGTSFLLSRVVMWPR